MQEYSTEYVRVRICERLIIGMKWAGILASVVVTIGLIIAVGFLITYLHPANQDITQEMDDDHDDWEGKLREAGEVGGGAGRGGQGAGRYKKQEVKTENHGALEVHLLEFNEKSEGGKTGESGLGETIIVTIMVIVSITAFCTISGCAYAMWKCGLCPEGRRRRRSSSSRSSSAGSGRKRTHSEDIELGELKLKMRKLEEKAEKARKEEEQEKKGQEKEMRKERRSWRRMWRRLRGQECGQSPQRWVVCRSWTGWQRFPWRIIPKDSTRRPRH